MSSSTNLILPTITLPQHITPHLRALIYASSPGSLVTHLSLSTPPNQQISLCQIPPTLPLYHPPTRNQPPTQIFLSLFPLSSHLSLTTHTIIFSTYLPTLTHELSPAVPLPLSTLSDSPSTILLRTRTSSHTHGLLILSEGKYVPVVTGAPPVHSQVVGAWASGHDVFVTAALLHLARHLYRRCNRRLGARNTVQKHVALIRFCEDGVMVKKGWVTVDRVRKWVCQVPLRGGTGEFRICGERAREVVQERREEQRMERAEARDVGRSRRGRAVREEDVDGDAVELVEDTQEEEFMVAKMREFHFGEFEESCDEGVVESEVAEDVVEVVEEDTQSSAELRVQDIDLDTLTNETYTTDSSSDGEKEDAMLEALCKQYLKHGWEEGVRRELARIDTKTNT